MIEKLNYLSWWELIVAQLANCSFSLSIASDTRRTGFVFKNAFLPLCVPPSDTVPILSEAEEKIHLPIYGLTFVKTKIKKKGQWTNFKTFYDR